jgi:hypothetical protein
MNTTFTDRNCGTCILAPRKNEVGSNVRILEQSHSNELIVLSGLRVL